MMSGLPTFPLFEWAQQTPVFVIDGRVWLAAPRGRTSSAWLSWNCERRELVKAQSLEEMWKDYASRHGCALIDCQAKRSGERDVRTISLAELRKQARQMEALAFVSQRLIPSLRRSRGGTVIAPPVSEAEARNWKQRLVAYAEVIQPPTLELLSSALPASDGWGLIDRLCYRLIRNSDDGGNLTLSQASYTLDEPLAQSVEIEARFYDRLKFLLRLWADRLRMGHPAWIERIECAFSRCEEWLRAQAADTEGRVYLYRRAGWRVFQQHGDWFAGLEVKPYAIEDADGSLYLFDSALITTRVTPDGPSRAAEVASSGYEHPFLPDDGRTICLGSYWDSAGHDWGRRSPEERVLQLLHDARQTLVSGWHVHNPFRAHRPLSDFGHRRINRRQAQALGLPIYPFYRRKEQVW